MEKNKVAAGLVGVLTLCTAASASAAGLNLTLRGPAIGMNPFPGTGILSTGIPRVGGLALALQNNDGDGHSVVGLTLQTGMIPTDVSPLPGLTAGALQLGLLSPPAFGDIFDPAINVETVTLRGLGTSTMTIIYNDGMGNSGFGLSATPVLPGF